MTRLTINEVAAKYNRHPETVRLAARSGELAGSQPKPRGRWVITEADAEAWINGDTAEQIAS
jgi:hypothetical protein